ncbi:MAG: hypothetical protein KBC60_08125 [Haliscomenobacter sp.]|nr:hypothetical protein [Haliscomenobacter sp.]
MTIPAFFLPQAFGFATLRVGGQAFKFRFVAGIDEKGGVIRRYHLALPALRLRGFGVKK